MSSSAGTSFYQFQYCDLCKLSHKQRKKKHVYSKRHQLTLKNTLLKLTEKVKIAKLSLGCPDIQSFGWEAGARVWCYFCQCEVPKHQARQDCTIANASFIHHLAHVDHAKKMHAFFWENWIPAGQKVDFFISREDAVR
ncbi:hypothetical protein V1264_017141 [Littorina saxatilis]|uniref:Uncharacterized protein n=1 Tax=Littorina saxatilis TaxID=31220 RepID=A0AAN9BIL9_9CAEN